MPLLAFENLRFPRCLESYQGSNALEPSKRFCELPAGVVTRCIRPTAGDLSKGEKIKCQNRTIGLPQPERDTCRGRSLSASSPGEVERLEAEGYFMQVPDLDATGIHADGEVATVLAHSHRSRTRGQWKE